MLEFAKSRLHSPDDIVSADGLHMSTHYSLHRNTSRRSVDPPSTPATSFSTLHFLCGAGTWILPGLDLCYLSYVHWHHSLGWPRCLKEEKPRSARRPLLTMLSPGGASSLRGRNGRAMAGRRRQPQATARLVSQVRF